MPTSSASSPFCPASTISGPERKENQQAAVQQVPVAGARLGVEISAADAVAKMCVPSKPTLQNHQSSEILTCSAV